MCGIAGAIGVRGDLGALGQRLLDALSHRGPDGSGTWRPEGPDRSVLLVHRRLSIFDLSPTGAQPMARARPGDPLPTVITFNGELYNFRELRAELESLGHPFVGTSDTEVLLAAYHQWGEELLPRIRGMFAWCLVDQSRGEAWLCRDRLGIKPLYVAENPVGGGLLFASEVRALLAAGPEFIDRKLDRSALSSFLAQGAVFGEQTLVRGIRALAPGESLWVDLSGRRLRRRRYWNLPFRPSLRGPDRAHGVAVVGETLRQAIKLQLAADVPVGIFLSGGVDSAALAAVATSLVDKVSTIAVGFDDPAFDETDTAARVAQALGTDHTTIRLEGRTVLTQMPRVLAAMDQPTVDGFNTFFVSQAARARGLPVALSGLGGDELFGGYASFSDVPRATMAGSVARLVPRMGRETAARLIARNGRRGVKVAALLADTPDVVGTYLLRRELFVGHERAALLPDHLPPWDRGVPSEVAEQLRSEVLGLDPVNQVSALEMSAYMRHMLLRDADVFSMASGVEMRVPLLDERLVELVARLPGSWKRPDPRPKPLLQDAVGDRLPAELSRGPKRGFTFPWGSWLAGPMRDRAREVMLDPSMSDHTGLLAEGVAQVERRWREGDKGQSPLEVLALWVLGEFVMRHGLRS